MSRVAKFWERETDGVRCTLCPHACLIKEGQVGLCKVRGVRDGKLLSFVYGRPASVVSDEIEKKPFFHFHPGTRACLSALWAATYSAPAARTGRSRTPERRGARPTFWRH